MLNRWRPSSKMILLQCTSSRRNAKWKRRDSRQRDEVRGEKIHKLRQRRNSAGVIMQSCIMLRRCARPSRIAYLDANFARFAPTCSSASLQLRNSHFRDSTLNGIQFFRVPLIAPGDVALRALLAPRPDDALRKVPREGSPYRRVTPRYDFNRALVHGNKSYTKKIFTTIHTSFECSPTIFNA